MLSLVFNNIGFTYLNPIELVQALLHYVFDKDQAVCSSTICREDVSNILPEYFKDSVL